MEQVREQFAFQAGQHVTVRADIDGERVQRSYSICSAAGAGSDTLEIAVRHVPGGVFSTFVLDQLQPGERSASTSNRNFEGRQGKGGRTHLVSPLVAAATAAIISAGDT